MKGSKENLRDAIQQIRLRIPTLLLFSFCLNLLILSAPIYMMQIYDRVLGSGRTETLIGLTLIAGIAALAMGALDIVRSQYLNRIARWFEEKLAPDVVAAGFRDALESRGFGTQALRDLATVRSFLTGNGLHALLDSPWVPVFLVLIWMMHPLLGIVGLISAIVLFAIALLNEHISRKPLQEADRASVINMQKVNSAVRGAEAVEAMGMLPGFLGKWIERNNTILGLQLAAADRSAAMVGISKFVRMLVQIVVLGVGAYLVLKSELSAGGMIAVSIVLGRALAPVEQSITAWRGLVAARTGWDRLREALERKQDTRDSLPLPIPTGRISCEHVVYRHPGREEPILSDVTFKIEPGEALGIIGPSAAGKSTLCRLLVGTARPVRGHVRLDGADVYTWPSERLGPHIGYLPQNVELFGGTVTENIARLSPQPDANAVVEAAQSAGVHDMILRMPNGYDTEIGEGGSFLSGGQRQRIGLARALYGKPRVIVLDEPNANLDSGGEQALLRSIEVAKAWGATIVMVAHQPYILRNADKLLLLHQGRVRAFGTRDEVFANAGANTPESQQVTNLGATPRLQAGPAPSRGADNQRLEG